MMLDKERCRSNSFYLFILCHFSCVISPGWIFIIMMVVYRHCQRTFQYNQLEKVHVPLYDPFKLKF